MSEFKYYTNPFNFISINGMFDDNEKKILSNSYPEDNYKTVNVNSHRIQIFDIRALVCPYHSVDNSNLPNPWKTLVSYLKSNKYRDFITEITGIDVSNLPMEASVFKYTKNCKMDAHTDLNLKVLTHVFYFNDEWDEKDGGMFCVLNSKNEKDIFLKILPIIGNSIIIIRSDNSWHCVEDTLVDKSRRSLVVAFYKEGCKEGYWWNPNEKYELHENKS